MSALALSAAAAPAGVWRRECAAEIRMAWRLPQFLLPTVLTPAAFYGLFTIAIAKSPSPAAAAASLAGYGVFAAIGPALFGFGAGVAMEREQGRIELKRVSPMPPGAFVAGKLCAALSTTAAALALIYLLGIVAGVRLAPGQWALLATVHLGSTLPHALIGLGIGMRMGGKGAVAIANALFLGSAVIGGLWIPSSYPAALDAVAWRGHAGLSSRSAGARRGRRGDDRAQRDPCRRHCGDHRRRWPCGRGPVGGAAPLDGAGSGWEASAMTMRRKGGGGGWLNSPWPWLAYLPFYCLPWLWQRPSSAQLIAFAVALLVFLPVYLLGYRLRGARLLAASTVLLGVAIALAPWGGSWTVFSIYAAAMAGTARPPRLAIGAIWMLRRRDGGDRPAPRPAAAVVVARNHADRDDRPFDRFAREPLRA